jgi:O-antigen/teichoic acid export membrane protein
VSLTPHDLEEVDLDLNATQDGAAVPQMRSHPGGRPLKLLSQFIFGQGAAQGLAVLINVLLVHKLSIEAYAQFGLAAGFQGFFAVLMDFGFATTIVPLVADRRDDKAVVGRYVRAASHLRNRSYLFLAPLAVVSFLGIAYRHHWGLGVQLMLMGSVLLSLYSGGTMSYFAAPLYIFGRLKDYYLPQAVFSVCRLGLYLLLAMTGHLTSWAAAGLAALATTATAGSIRRRSTPLLEWPTSNSPETNREVLRYIMPAAPAIIFSAFQPQISLFLVSIFGGTLYIAQVAALGRLGQAFAMLMTFGNIVIEPYIARLPRSRLPRAFVTVALLTCAAMVPVVFAAFHYPGAFIWIIGSKYSSLRDLLGWYVLSNAMNIVSGFFWVMNRGRKWVFWSGSVLEVVLLLAVQIGYLALVGVRNTRQAVFFSLAASFCYMIAHGYVTLYGFWRQSRQNAATTENAAG